MEGEQSQENRDKMIERKAVEGIMTLMIKY